ncbi:MAG TPA: hypothetical protein VJ728_18065 [Candidatus Binataceae bacterium]|nr:hypothetical protein [Candidatus Binataceae bacterium]
MFDFIRLGALSEVSSAAFWEKLRPCINDRQKISKTFLGAGSLATRPLKLISGKRKKGQVIDPPEADGVAEGIQNVGKLGGQRNRQLLRKISAALPPRYFLAANYGGRFFSKPVPAAGSAAQATLISGAVRRLAEKPWSGPGAIRDEDACLRSKAESPALAVVR